MSEYVNNYCLQDKITETKKISPHNQAVDYMVWNLDEHR